MFGAILKVINNSKRNEETYRQMHARLVEKQISISNLWEIFLIFVKKQCQGNLIFPDFLTYLQGTLPFYVDLEINSIVLEIDFGFGE